MLSGFVRRRPCGRVAGPGASGVQAVGKAESGEGLAQIHPDAESAAETSEFAGAHKKFWEMHDLLFENQDQLGLPLYQELAETLGLPVEQLIEALETGKFTAKVRSDFSAGVRSGVNGTPTFFINGVRYDGPVDVLADALQQELQRAA